MASEVARGETQQNRPDIDQDKEIENDIKEKQYLFGTVA